MGVILSSTIPSPASSTEPEEADVDNTPQSPPCLIMRLPPELLSCVMRHVFCRSQHPGCSSRLYSNREGPAKDALLACSQVCYAMRQAALPFLFCVSAVRVNQLENTDKSYGLEWWAPDEWSCRPLPDLMAVPDAYPHLCKHVRELRLHTSRLFRSETEPLETLAARTLFDIARGFPNLRVLVVQATDLQSDGPAVVRAEDAFTRPLESFTWGIEPAELSQPIELCASKISHVLSAFSRITTITLAHLEFAKHDQVATSTSTAELQRPIEVASLCIRECRNTRHALAFFSTMRVFDPARLRALSLHSLRERDFTSVAAFLRVYGARLRELTLGMKALDKYSKEWDPMIYGFSECRRLRHLTLGLGYERKIRSSLVALLLRAFSQHSRLRDVTLLLDKNRVSKMFTIASALMIPIEDALLCLPSLERVQFGRLGCVDIDESEYWKEWMTNEARMSCRRLRAKGVILP